MAIGCRPEPLAQRRADLASAWDSLSVRDWAVIKAESAMSGATLAYDQAFQAFMSEKDRTMRLKRLIPHMRFVREAAQATMVVKGTRLLPSRTPLGPPPSFDPKNAGLRVLETRHVDRAAPVPVPAVRNGGGQTAYNPARPSLQEGL